MTDTEKALRRAIVVDPYDDTPRLALADYLFELGGGTTPCTREKCKGGRVYMGMDGMKWIKCFTCDGTGRVETPEARFARFIRDQFEYPNGDPEGESVRYFTGTLVPSLGFHARFVRFEDYRKGFLDSIQMTLGQYLEHHLVLFEHHPITRVTLSDRIAFPCTYESPSRHTLYHWNHHDPRHATDTWMVDESALPSRLFDRLKYGPNKPYRRDYGDAAYLSTSDASRALSASCVAWGRYAVKLPELSHYC